MSVVVPACDEADKIDATAGTLLRQDYPDLQIILVNDRSTDATGAIIDKLAAPVAAAILLRAGVLGFWRGTIYPAAALRAGRRVKPGV